MNFTEVATTESKIASDGLDHLKKEAFMIPVSGEPDLTLSGMVCHRKDGLASYYFQEVVPKERIVLHFTAGHLRGDLVTLTGDIHVSVAYVIARDGTIYQLFDPKHWSYHLGPGCIGGNKVQSSKTIGIELSNYGPLILNGTQLETIYATVDRRDPYCALTDTEQYLKLDAPFRARNFYAAFTDRQYDSLVLLLRHLTNLFSIPRQFLTPDQRYETRDAILTRQGIVSHVNYRPSGKWDIGPAFDWDRVIEDVLSDTFKPLSATERAIKRKKQQIKTAEQELKEQRAKVKALKNELKQLQEEIASPANRSFMPPQGIISQDDANGIYVRDRSVPEQANEENIEPGVLRNA